MMRILAAFVLYLQCVNASCSNLTTEAECWPAQRQRGCWWEVDRCEYVVPAGYDLQTTYRCTSQDSTICAGYVQACYELACGECEACEVGQDSSECPANDWNDDGRGCPGKCSGGCCIGEDDNWCSDNYREGFVCRNNVCGDDDCCTPSPLVGIIVVLALFFCAVTIVCLTLQRCIKKGCAPREQEQARTAAQSTSSAAQLGGGVAMAPVGIPMAIAQPIAPPNSMMVVCPPGVPPGGTLVVTTPTGEQVQASVPIGVVEGQQFLVQLAAPPVAVAQAVPC